MPDKLETIKEIETMLADFSSKTLVRLFRQSFVNGHNWDYDAALVRTVLLDRYKEIEGAEAAESLRATALDT